MSRLDAAITTLTNLQAHITQQTSYATAAVAGRNLPEAIRLIDLLILHSNGQLALARLDREHSKKNRWRWIKPDPRFAQLDALESGISTTCNRLATSRREYQDFIDAAARQEAARQAETTRVAPTTAPAALALAPVAGADTVAPAARTTALAETRAPMDEETAYTQNLARLEALALANQSTHPDVNVILRDLINQVKQLKRERKAPTLDLNVVLEDTYRRLTPPANNSSNYHQIYLDTAKTMQGHPSPALRALGYTMLALSIVVLLAGIIFIPHLAVGVGTLIVCSTGVGATSLLSAAASVGFFSLNRPGGVCKAMQDLDKNMHGKPGYALTQDPPATIAAPGIGTAV